jgi:y4mF family transcriptional regulator
MDFYDIIKDRRALLNITQQDLADISGVSLRTIKAIEKGNGNPSIDTLRKIADALGLELIMKVREIPKLWDRQK